MKIAKASARPGCDCDSPARSEMPYEHAPRADAMHKITAQLPTVHEEVDRQIDQHAANAIGPCRRQARSAA